MPIISNKFIENSEVKDALQKGSKPIYSPEFWIFALAVDPNVKC